MPWELPFDNKVDLKRTAYWVLVDVSFKLFTMKYPQGPHQSAAAVIVWHMETWGPFYQ